MTILAIFDMDETIIDCDSSSLWLRYLVQRGVAAADMLVTEQAMMQAYHLGELSMAQYMDFTLQPLSGVAVSEVERWADDFVASMISTRIFPAARRQIEWHRQQGNTLLIISATADFIVRRIAAMLGVSEVIAIELEQVAGNFTGATKGVLSFREGKVERLQAWLQDHGNSLQGSYGYSDSVNDLPLLHAVQHACVVNPAPALKQVSDQHQWRQYDWQLAQHEHSVTGQTQGAVCR
ncbi:HAD family hydrolase [Pseudomonas sp. H11T01]|uniref:HAD family hydrolase n=1 Tax=Pseudomonas sp. H11T01 TaxID=3402749 RepID=UPI003AD26FAA